MSTIGLLEVLGAFAWVSRKQEVNYSLGPITAGLLPNPAYNLLGRMGSQSLIHFQRPLRRLTIVVYETPYLQCPFNLRTIRLFDLIHKVLRVGEHLWYKGTCLMPLRKGQVFFSGISKDPFIIWDWISSLRGH